MLYIVHSVLVWKVAAMETKVYIKIRSYMYDYNNDLCFLKKICIICTVYFCMDPMMVWYM